MRALLRTDDSLPLMIVRLALGIVILPHGLQKTLGLFGGPGYSGTMGMFTSQGMPAALAFLVILGESAGSLGLIVGFLSRIAGFGISCIMLGAIAMVHWPNGLFMNWSGKQAGEGFEFHILALGIALAVLVGGGGKSSVDRAIVESS
jgi:putative oxidoreductase